MYIFYEAIFSSEKQKKKKGKILRDTCEKEIFRF